MRANRNDSDRGAGLVEYALLIALVAIVAVGAIGFVGSRADATLSDGALVGSNGSTTTTTAAPTTTTEAPTTTTTAPPTTTTTRPRGVPKDWPADKPIPPMPDNCRKPKLEDNGRWNCQR